MIQPKYSHLTETRAVDQRQRVLLLLVPFLAIAFWLLVRDSIWTTATVTAALADHGGTKSQEGDVPGITWELPPLYRIGGRDPMQLAASSDTEPGYVAAPAPSRTPLVLRGILYTPEKPVAMIGSSLAFEGQRIGLVKVVRIERDSVEFEMDGRRWLQKIVNPTIAPPADEPEQEESVLPVDPEELR